MYFQPLIFLWVNLTLKIHREIFIIGGHNEKNQHRRRSPH
jgi:hypothetical protein